jgi:hypothetical protein
MQTEECKPSPDPQQPQFIIGYGSLMETAPKARENLPILVREFERG